VILFVVAVVSAACSSSTATTQQPTATQQAKPETVVQRLNNALDCPVFGTNEGSRLDGIKLVYSSKHTIDATLNVGVLNRDDDAKLNAYVLFMCLYTSGVAPIASITFHQQTLLVDSYGKTSTGDFSVATLTSTTESRFVWGNLDQDSAWAVYDYTWLLY